MARLFLDPGQTFGFIGPYETTEVIGTNDTETVIVEANGKANFDPSFNRGGDEIVILSDSTNYKGALSGSNLVITNDFGASLRIPVGSAGTTITFDDGSFSLVLSDGAVKLGDQTVTNTPATFNQLGESMAQPAAALGATVDAPPAVDTDLSSNITTIG